MDYQELSRKDTRAEPCAGVIACSIVFASVNTHLAEIYVFSFDLVDPAQATVSVLAWLL